MTVSYWRRLQPETLETDVAVIGAGIAGLSASIELGRARIGSILLERHSVGYGASTRNAGFLMRGMAENYLLCVRALGRESAREVWRRNEENIEALRAEGITSMPSFVNVPSCLVATTEKEARQLERSHEMLREDGFRVDWIEAGDDSLWRSGIARAGLVNPDDAACDPAELVAFLRSEVRSPVRENAEICAIRARNEGIELVGPGLVVRAHRALVCTNAWAPALLPALEGLVRARRGQMLAMRAQNARLDRSYYLNWGGEYLRQTPEGVIVIGGFRKSRENEEVGLDDSVTPEIQSRIEGLAREIFPRPCEVVARWAGIMGFSPDGLPLVGPVPGEWPEGSVWFCGGFTGHGMSIGFNTARAAVRSMLDASANHFPIERCLAR